MPEEIMPKGVVRGSLEHILLITLTVSIDYQRNAEKLWNSSRETFEDPTTRYLFDYKALYETPLEKVIENTQKHKLSQKHKKDAKIWMTVVVTFYEKWSDDPRNFL
ncbi:MAG: hypothetical protein ACP5T0_00100 [Verrucomicrobiia bacterium]